MATLRIPRLGESIFEVGILRWLKRVGDRVAIDEPLVELETDKMDVVLPSPAAGVLSQIHAAEGQRVPIGSEVATIVEAEPT